MSSATIILIILTAFVIHATSYASTQFVLPVSLNSSVSGTISASPISIFANFSKRDVNEDVGLAEQRLFQFNVTHSATPTKLQISTCDGTSFDSYLVLFDGNPVENQNENLRASVLAESANDLACTDAIERAALIAMVPVGTYFVLLTGNGADHGFFNLTITAIPATPTPTPWHLDRIDQRTLPLNGRFSITDSADDIFVYLIDSGVNMRHEEFEGRVESGYDFVRNTDVDTPDCTGHGTHIAGLIAGRTFGVAKKARVISVRVFGCNHKAQVSAITDALHWVLVHSEQTDVRHRFVIALMASFNGEASKPLQFVMNEISRRKIPVVVPAGDYDDDACNIHPASESTFLTVGAIAHNDARASFSNYGPCIDLYAPGMGLPSAWHSSTNAVITMSGTAQAAAVATGAVALLLALNRQITAPQVKNILFSVGTADVIDRIAENDTGRLVYVRSIPAYDGGAPARGFVYLFMVLRAQLQSCALDSLELGMLRQALARLILADVTLIEARCNVTRVTTADMIGSGNLLRSESSMRQNDDHTIHVQIEIEERGASSAFITLEQAFGADKSIIEESLGFEFMVTDMPWAIDSRNVVYWGAPTFPDGRADRLTAGQMVAVMLSVILLMCALGISIWLCHRRMTRKDEIESMQGSADLERGPVEFQDYEDDDIGLQKVRSFRNLKRAVSFRRMSNARDSFEIHAQGMNSMSSFIGKHSTRIQPDAIRVQSFGGEAFASMTALERRETQRSFTSSGSSMRDMSARGMHRPLERLHSQQVHDDSSSGDLMVVRSMGGEAFAQIMTQLDSTRDILNEDLSRTVVDDSLRSTTSTSIGGRSDADALQMGFMYNNNS